MAIDKLTVIEHEGDLLVDSRLIAERLGIHWESWEAIVTSALEECPLYLTAWDSLAICRHASLISSNTPGLLELVESIFYSHFSAKERRTWAWLRLSVTEGLAQDTLCQSNEAGRVCSWFRQNYLEVFPGAGLQSVHAKNGKRPDFLIVLEATVIPVECKLRFDGKALKQLKGYMKLWGVETGIAVAPKFTTEIPPNIVRVVCL